jgi:hypothetical protein
VRVLNVKRYDYNIRQIQDLRRFMGISRQTTNIAKTAKRYARIATLLADELERDSLINYLGKTLLHE